jgi:hypothetical protein
MGHARLSCSGAYRWIPCPGSPALESRFPRTTSEAAEEGTRAHALHEAALLLGAPAVDCLDLVPEATVEMAEHVQVSLDWIEADFAQRPGAALFVERKLRPGKAIGRSDLWGTADALILDAVRREVVVIDLKYGMGEVVDVNTTPQLPLYGLGAKALAPFAVKTVQMVITQPRAPHRDGPVRSVTRSAAELDTFANQIRIAASRTDDPGAPLVPGDHCRYCRAAGGCPALAEQALRSAEQEFAAMAANEELKDPLPPERIAELLHEAEVVKAWARSLEEHALRLAEAGTRLPGWRLVRRRGKRAWNDPGVALQTLLQDYPVDEDALAPRILRSPRQVEMAIKEACRRKADLSALASVPDIGWRLAPDTAPGDDFMDAEAEFSDIDPEDA